MTDASLTYAAVLRRIVQLARTSPDPISSQTVQATLNCAQACSSRYLRELVALGCLQRCPALPNNQYNRQQYIPGSVTEVPDRIARRRDPPKQRAFDDKIVIITPAKQLGARRDPLIAALFGPAGTTTHPSFTHHQKGD